jgi:uridine kinase
MLARRIRRDTVERGRDVNGILDQVSCGNHVS